MDELTFNGFVIGWLSVAVVTFIALFFVTAPYGRHARKGWGPMVPARLGWIFMEVLSPALVATLFVFGKNQGTVAIVFLVMWEVHYIQRTFVFPFLMRGKGAPMPLAIVVFSMMFNAVNAGVNGGWLFHMAPEYSVEWLTDPRFIVGAALFVTGFAINLHSDHILRNLRKPGETGYKIPHGGMYRFVSCPNYMGESIEWIGWAIATWSLAGLSFAVWTLANLAPRAFSNHRWYKEQFPDYPTKRKALIPFIL